MKVAFIAAMVAAITASAIIVVPGFSTRSTQSASIPARVKSLERKVKALQGKVNTLTARVAADEACTQAVEPVTQFTGYVYSNDGGATYGFSTALDVPVAGESTQFYFDLVDPQCVGTKATMHRVLRTQPGAVRHSAR
jgi:hypothetical protein